jgi:RNase H-like domain found in reverse transcriptase/Integrase zinc binding domain/Chromo (CHRromatin Organisation MOdifier) domain
VGAVLSQEGGTGPANLTKPKLHPVAYYSATFTSTEWNYDIYKRELLAIMKALVHWRQYLRWTKEPFTIMMDHTNLQYWKSLKNLNWCTAQWHADLQEYNYEILYILGKTNMPPDVLSRSLEADQGKKDNKDVVIIPDEKFKIAATEIEGKIRVPNLNKVKCRIIRLIHDLPTARHPGWDKTLRKAQEHYYWPHMKEWIVDYVKGCTICQQNKILTHCKRSSAYHILTEPNTWPFQWVAMDLIMGLPPVKDKDTILTIVDQGCSCVAIFLPCSMTIIGVGIAKQYQDHVFWWFRLPTKIISDRDTRFTSHFSKALMAWLSIDQNLSTAFHPQTDSLSERKDQWVEQYLCLVTSATPEDWKQWLALASAIHNNRRNVTTGLSPNQILLGYDITPNLSITPQTLVESAEEWIKIITQRREQAIEALNKTAEKSETLTVQYKEGQCVWLEAMNLSLPHQASKLAPHRYGPFKITEEISPVVYRLELLTSWRIHDVFHASLLSPYSKTTAHRSNFTQPPPDLIDGETEYKVEQICSHQYFGYHKKLQYLVKWQGYLKADNTWEPAENIHTLELLKIYHRRAPTQNINTSQANPIANVPQSHFHLRVPSQPSLLLSLHYSQVPWLHPWPPLSPYPQACPRTPLFLQGMFLPLP